MKKILGIVAGIVGIISVIVGVALKMNNNAIAIIGGADGPTSVFVAGKLNSVLVCSCQHLAYCDRCCDVDSSDNFLFEEKKVK